MFISFIIDDHLQIYPIKRLIFEILIPQPQPKRNNSPTSKLKPKLIMSIRLIIYSM